MQTSDFNFTVFNNNFFIPTIIELYIGNQLVQSQTITYPDEFVKSEFINIVNQIIHQNQPMKVIFIRYVDIYDRFENKHKQLKTTLEFWNWKDD